MERNDVSFSIPTWRQQEIKSIKSIGLAEEQALYMTSPYNLNDFKNEHQSVDYIFAPNEEPSQINPYTTKRVLHAKVSKQIAIFTTFLYEILLNDNFLNNQKSSTPENILIEDKQSQKLLDLFKQKLLPLNMCRFEDVPQEFKIYYRNQIIKKVIFQYLSKCAYNVSLIQVLLMNNEFLRFSIQSCVKSVLYQGTLISKFKDEVSFDQQAKIFVNYFECLLIKKDEKQDVKQSQTKLKRIFRHQANTLKAQHHLLAQQAKNKRIYLHRKQRKIIDPQIEIGSQKIKEDKSNKQKQVVKQKAKKPKPVKTKNPPGKRQASNQQRKTSLKSKLLSCLPCFNRD